MTRPLELSRDDAELLVDLLMASDHYLAEGLEKDLRRIWGMTTRERQLEAGGLTLEAWRTRQKGQP